MKKGYREIKKNLLNDYNIVSVSVDGNYIFVEPRQDESYFEFTEVFANFLNEYNDIVISDKEFKIVGYEHYNTQIFNLTLKEVC